MLAPGRRAFVPLAAVAVSLAACHRGDSILLVEIAGDLSLMPASFQIVVRPAQAAARTFDVAPQSGRTVTLPTSLSIEMPPDLTGPVMVTVSAFDLDGRLVGFGGATQTTIDVGGQTIVVVTLAGNVVPPPPVDAGSGQDAGAGGVPGLDDAAAGAGGAPGTGGGSGTGGARGTGGVRGTGGLSGTGGAAGSPRDGGGGA